MPTGIPAINHVVVLMFENRSFDHVFGSLLGVDGVLQADGRTLKPELYNLPDPTQPPSESNRKIPPQEIVPRVLAHDFNHDFSDGMIPDLFGPPTITGPFDPPVTPPPGVYQPGITPGTTGFLAGQPVGQFPTTYPPTNSGFYSTIAYNAGPDLNNGIDAMSFHRRGSLRVLHRLAEEFVVCDRWFCDMPGHTEPNRAFMHCATAGNYGVNDTDYVSSSNPLTAPTIFEQIQNFGQTWKIYVPAGGQCDASWLNDNIQASPNAFVPLAQFASDAASGSLPFYSFIMCWSGNATPETDTSMHPAADIRAGENLLAAVYNTLRQHEANWNDTLFIVTFDENGGIYDHVMPPTTVPPDAAAQPDSFTCPNPSFAMQRNTSTFDFTLLGPRIPAFVISPWLRAGIESRQFQNTSILRLLQDLLPRPGDVMPPFLTDRDRAARSVAEIFSTFGLDRKRDDCPAWIEPNPGFPFANGRLREDLGAIAERESLPPQPHMIEVAARYHGWLPGHADSGKPFPREFASYAALNRYVRERQEAARRHRSSA